MPEDAEPSQPRRARRRVILWSAALAGLLLCLAWCGANWKVFHLAWCRHLMSSRDGETRNRGVAGVCGAHLRKGMTVGEVRRLFRPLALTAGQGPEAPRAVSYPMYVGGLGHQGWMALTFDERGRLAGWSAAGPNWGK